MTFKLISEHPVIHDFAHKMGWGHNIEGDLQGSPYGFEGLITYQVEWDIFNPRRIHAGDIIIRNMNSGKIGAFEVISVDNDSLRGQTPFGPRDLYKCTLRFCGYYNREINGLSILNGYGIEVQLPLLRRRKQ